MWRWWDHSAQLLRLLPLGLFLEEEYEKADQKKKKKKDESAAAVAVIERSTVFGVLPLLLVLLLLRQMTFNWICTGVPLATGVCVCQPGIAAE